MMLYSSCHYILYKSHNSLFILHCNILHLIQRLIKVSGPFVETSCVFQCIKNIINDEMWA